MTRRFFRPVRTKDVFLGRNKPFFRIRPRVGGDALWRRTFCVPNVNPKPSKGFPSRSGTHRSRPHTSARGERHVARTRARVPRTRPRVCVRASRCLSRVSRVGGRVRAPSSSQVSTLRRVGAARAARAAARARARCRVQRLDEERSSGSVRASAVGSRARCGENAQDASRRATGAAVHAAEHQNRGVSRDV